MDDPIKRLETQAMVEKFDSDPDRVEMLKEVKPLLKAAKKAGCCKKGTKHVRKWLVECAETYDDLTWQDKALFIEVMHTYVEAVTKQAISKALTGIIANVVDGMLSDEPGDGPRFIEGEVPNPE